MFTFLYVKYTITNFAILARIALCSRRHIRIVYYSAISSSIFFKSIFTVLSKSKCSDSMRYNLISLRISFLNLTILKTINLLLALKVACLFRFKLYLKIKLFSIICSKSWHIFYRFFNLIQISLLHKTEQL